MKKLKHYIKEILIFLILLTVATNLMSIYKSQSLNTQPLTIKQLELLNHHSYPIQNDKPIIIHFWATWCPVCKVEASNINILSKYFQVITIAVKSGSDKEIQTYLQKHGYSYKVVNDRDGRLAQKFHIAGFPTTFIYDKKHRLRFSDVGYTSTIGLFLRTWWASF